METRSWGVKEKASDFFLAGEIGRFFTSGRLHRPPPLAKTRQPLNED
jgi:hypothetical protein